MERAPTGPAPAIPERSPTACPARATPPYLPRHPQTSPLYRVLADHFTALERVHEERFEPTHGPLRAAARAAVGRFLECGLLEHGFARVRCGTCRAEFLVAYHFATAKRLAGDDVAIVGGYDSRNENTAGVWVFHARAVAPHCGLRWRCCIPDCTLLT